MIINLVCQICDKKITGEDGYLCVDWIKAIATAEAWEKFSRERDGKIVSATSMWDVSQQHPEVKWHTYHRTCDPDPHSNDYWIGADRITTLAELLNWNQHLNGKGWTKHADWNAMLAAATKARARIVIKEIK